VDRLVRMILQVYINSYNIWMQMDSHWFRKQGLISRLSVALLLVIYLSVYPAVILCDLHCEITAVNGDTGLSGNHSNHTHSHGHGHSDSQPNPAPHSESHQQDKNSSERYSFCSFAQSVSYIGIFSIPFHITGIFEIAENPRFHEGDIVSQTFYLNLHNRAPPLSSFA